MKRYTIHIEGEMVLLDSEVDPTETPEQAAARLLGPMGMDVSQADLMDVVPT